MKTKERLNKISEITKKHVIALCEELNNKELHNNDRKLEFKNIMQSFMDISSTAIRYYEKRAFSSNDSHSLLHAFTNFFEQVARSLEIDVAACHSREDVDAFIESKGGTIQ